MKFEGFSDDALARSIAQGSTTAFDALLTRYEARLYQFALLLTQSERAAEEVLLSVFSTFYNELQSGVSSTKVETRLFRLAISCVSAIGASAYPRSIDAVSSQLELSFEGTENAGQDIEGLLHRLPLEYRIISLLNDVDGMPTVTVAKVLEMSRADVRRILRRSRALLRRWSKRTSVEPELSAGQTESTIPFPTVFPVD